MNLIHIHLNSSDWSKSTASIYTKSAEGYPLVPTTFTLLEVATKSNRLADLDTVISHFLSVGSSQHFTIFEMFIRQNGTTKDVDLDAEGKVITTSPERPILQITTHSNATSSHPNFDQIAGPKRDYFFSEDLPNNVRDSLLNLYAEVVRFFP